MSTLFSCVLQTALHMQQYLHKNRGRANMNRFSISEKVLSVKAIHDMWNMDSK